MFGQPDFLYEEMGIISRRGRSLRPGTGRNEVTADHVLLHTLQMVHLTADGSLVEHLRRLLEGGSRHERLGLKGGTGDTLQDLSRRSRNGVTHLNQFHIATLQHRVLIAQTTGSDNLTLLQVLGVAGIGDHPR